MQLNRSNVLFFVGTLIVIALLFVVINQQSTPVTPTAVPTTSAGGPVFPDINSTEAQTGIVRIEISNHTAIQKMVMTKDAGGVWKITESDVPDDIKALATDQTKAVELLNTLAALNATDIFTTDNIAQFGLDAPAYTFTLTDGAGKAYVLNVGKKAPANPRYYTQVGDDTTKVYLVQSSTIDTIAGKTAQPPYVPSPTPMPTFTATPNPYSEVEQTATAAVEQALATDLAATALATLATPVPTDAAISTPEVTLAPVEASATPLPPTATQAPSATPVPPTATNAPSITPVPPTATQAPSATPVPPTATLKPSSTPKPATATPAPSATPA